MKKIKITGHHILINPTTQKLYSVAQFRSMNSYYENIIEVEDDYNKLTLCIDLQEKYPELRTYNLKFEEIK